MRKFLQRLLTKPVSRLADKYSSRPDKRRVYVALNRLYNNIVAGRGKKGPVIDFDSTKDKFVILSDQHKGGRDRSDIFALAENNYLAALEHYNSKDYTYINLGDSEELWGNLFITVNSHNKATFAMEREFLKRKAFIKIFGNHDLYWDNDPLAALSVLQVYGESIKVYEGAVLKTTIDNQPLSIFLTHGHQGDRQSDGNWFSKWFVSNIWAPLQSFLQINLNTPAYNNQLKTDHNRIMYEWVAEKENMLLITGHTHQPVFASFTHLEKLYNELLKAKAANNLNKMADLQKQVNIKQYEGETIPNFTAYKPTYFNTGCCCFSDGDITGIEICEDCIRLIKWEYDANGTSKRFVLDETTLSELIKPMATPESVSTVPSEE
ncbi:metallophosphoesterase [Mucilaginibacter hurinus]|uniref:Metallophosphoesterase n=1 Tax=Mucilaginibacter hurinus TaxID=2201324 RepID=A0A367GN43_9SPHI|nr:metallophosphoesterase [Mucilaginibacter hurinus]RCH54912.1 metallophosphoesterase [Mucilaginibacter hurinus]